MLVVSDHICRHPYRYPQRVAVLLTGWCHEPPEEILPAEECLRGSECVIKDDPRVKFRVQRARVSRHLQSTMKNGGGALCGALLSR